MRQLIDWSTHAHVLDGDVGVVAFFLVFAHDSAYDGTNYAWFVDRYPDGFLYLDRIVVAESHRRRGIGAADLLPQIETQATPGRLTCEIVCEPPNTASLAFHQSRGFVEVGTLRSRTGRCARCWSRNCPDDRTVARRGKAPAKAAAGDSAKSAAGDSAKSAAEDRQVGRGRFGQVGRGR